MIVYHVNSNSLSIVCSLDIDTMERLVFGSGFSVHFSHSAMQTCCNCLLPAISVLVTIVSTETFLIERFFSPFILHIMRSRYL